MWPKRSNRNRRLSPGQKLQVKLSIQEARAASFKWAATAILGALGTVFVLYLLWRLGDWSLDKFVYENPAFAIGQVDIQTDGSIPLAELRRWSGVKPGANLIALDTAAVKRNLELVSTIDTVSIERIPPRTLIIRVKERRAVAQVNQLRALPTGEMMVSVFQMDVNGHVMQPLGLSFLPLDRLKPQFPAIVGLNPAELQPGHSLQSSQGLAALALIAAFDKSTLIGRVDLQSVDVSVPGVLVATSQAGGEVTFAPDHLDQQMRRWREVYDWARTAGKTIASIDLAVSNDVPVKWNFASAEPDSTQQLKHLHSRRKNV
jgi:hypothetical protein